MRVNDRYSISAALAVLILCTNGAEAQAPTAAAPASPESSQNQQYESLTQRGIEAHAAGRSAEARALFEQAHASSPSARTLRALGITALALNRYTEARAELSGALSHPTLPLSAAQRSEVTQLLDWMRTNLGSVRVDCKPVEAEAKIDGKPLDRPEMLLEPKQHELRITAAGFQAHEQRFQLDIADRLILRVELIAQPLPSAAHAPSPPLSYGSAHSDRAASGSAIWPWLGGAGLVAVAVGGTMFGLGLHDYATVEGARDVWLSEVEAAQTRAPWLVFGGIGLAAVGVAGIAAALVLWMNDRDDRGQRAAWNVTARGESVALERQF